jgi:hypothetical protein
VFLIVPSLFKNKKSKDYKRVQKHRHQRNKRQHFICGECYAVDLIIYKVHKGFEVIARAARYVLYDCK